MSAVFFIAAIATDELFVMTVHGFLESCKFTCGWDESKTDCVFSKDTRTAAEGDNKTAGMSVHRGLCFVFNRDTVLLF